MNIAFDQTKIQFLADHLDVDDFISLLNSISPNDEVILRKMNIIFDMTHFRNTDDVNVLLSVMEQFHLRTSCAMTNYIFFEDEWTPPLKYDLDTLTSLLARPDTVFKNINSLFQICYHIFHQELNNRPYYDNENLRLLISYIVSDYVDEKIIYLFVY